MNDKQIKPVKATKKLYLVDDHPVFREGLVALIEQEPGLTVCGHANSAAEAVTAAIELKPDLMLVDIGLPGRSGLELIKDLQAVRPETGVLVLSMHDEMVYAERVLRAGGRGYIMKQEGPEMILQAIRAVLEGQIFLSSRMSARILGAFSGHREKTGTPISRLTDRELEILQLVGQGRDSHAIAEQLNLSSKTVDAHRTHIKEKLALKNHTELISYAARWMERQ